MATPVAEKRTKSGEHEAVKAFRAKLASIVDNTTPELDALNDLLEEYLVEVRSEPPPGPNEHE